jgi:hypothetical protein
MKTPTRARNLAAGGNRHSNRVIQYLMRIDDGAILRWAFRVLLVVTVAILGMDLRDLGNANGWLVTGSETPLPGQPVLPPAVTIESPEGGNDPRPFVTADDARLGQPMVFTLEPGGRLKAEGTIDPGASSRLAEELTARGEYVKIVSLNSPGGALDDAMKMAQLIRERSLDTEVGDGALCASSCPLVLAGGAHRAVAGKAAVGVHQFYAATETTAGPEQVMADAQATTARISRHLTAMDVDPALWLHALDTPPRSLYYFTPDELLRYKLISAAQKTAKKK